MPPDWAFGPWAGPHPRGMPIEPPVPHAYILTKHRDSRMITALIVVVGGVVAWLLVDRGLTWWRERNLEGPSTWHGQGPGSTIHSDGFEDTLPPHEAAERATGSAGASARAPS